MSSESVAEQQRGILGAIERVGNRLPDPVFLFGYLIIGLVVISVISSWLGVSAAHPVLAITPARRRWSMLRAYLRQRMWRDFGSTCRKPSRTFTHWGMCSL